jgi:hypothetical protein
VTPGARVLEIGCGWGGLAEIAAGEFGAHVTGVTLSREQLQWGQARMQALGLGRQVELRYQDYRDLAERHADAPFDAIVSIEMFEAVGREYWRGYFETLRACLKPGGHACIQTITIRDDLFERYVRSTDFIQQYIFPGGLLPSPSAFEAEARRAGFVVEQRLAFGPTTPRPCAAGARPSCARSTRCSAWASTPASSASGPSTWPTARRPSTPATPTSSSSRCASPCHDIPMHPSPHCTRRRSLARMAGMLATLPVTLSPP